MNLDLAALLDTLVEWVARWGLKVVGALVFVFIGMMLAKLVRRGVRKGMERGGADPTLVPFIGNIVYALLLTGIFIAAAGMVEIPVSSFVAIVGAAGLAIALAFQGTLSHLASGVMLLTFRPFKVGDFVDAAGTSGTVTEIGIFHTILTTPDNLRIIVPNSKISSDVIKNYSANDTRRIDLVIGVGYDDDLNVAIETAHRVLAAEERVLAEPEPQVWVSEMADSSVNLIVRPWVKTSEFWPTRWTLIKTLKEEIEAAGLTIPYPQRDVHLFRENGE